MTAAHQTSILTGTAKEKPVDVPISEIASTGYPLEAYSDVEKVQRMQRSIQKGKKIKPVRLTKLTPELRDMYGVTDPNKKYYLNAGHHRLAAAKLEGKDTIRAVPYHGRRI